MNYPLKKALLSVTNKENIVDLANVLIEFGVEIISSGGTGKVLSDNGISFTPIEMFTGNPEAFGGRMKTLSFQVGSALLFKRDSEDDVKQAKDLNIDAIDLVVCNLYPFEEIYQKGERDLDRLVEYIDIGGPCMLRAAAKNFNAVCTLTDPSDYAEFSNHVKLLKGSTDLNFRKKMAIKTFNYSSHYESFIARALLESVPSSNNEIQSNNDFQLNEFDKTKAKPLRYGENPHQQAWVIPQMSGKNGLAQAKPLQGKELSYNNFLDADAALRSNRDISRAVKGQFENVVTIIKHSNPCGAAAGMNALETLAEAWSGDPISSFGSIICFNHEVSAEQANWLNDKFVEVLLAPKFSFEAKEIFAKKKNLRIFTIDTQNYDQHEKMMRSIDGGVLVQEEDTLLENEFQNVTKLKMDEETIKNIVPFGLMVTKHFKSNAISLVGKSTNGVKLYGAGMGNPNRLVSLEQAAAKVRENGLNDFSELVLISDAFFPFADNIEMANSYGVKMIVEPGGSIKDNDVISACDEFAMKMVFTGKRHFRH